MAVNLKSKEKTELFMNNMIQPPRSKEKGTACLTFRYKKYFPGMISVKFNKKILTGKSFRCKTIASVKKSCFKLSSYLM